MKHIIDKSFSFCYGHRVHNQRLDTKFTESGDNCLACRHLHGHEGIIKVFLEEEVPGINVAKTGMVTDFKHLGWFKSFIDDVLDHKMILDIKDPIHAEQSIWLLDDDENIDMGLLHKMPGGYWIPNLTFIQEQLQKWEWVKTPEGKAKADAIIEKYEGYILVDFVPTSENISAWLLSVVQNKIKALDGVKVTAVEYWETPKSHCRVEV